MYRMKIATKENIPKRMYLIEMKSRIIRKKSITIVTLINVTKQAALSFGGQTAGPKQPKHMNYLYIISNQIVFSKNPLMNQNVPTFQENMFEVLSLKEQLIKLHHIFSPDAVNFHQIKTTDLLRKQVKNSQEKLIDFCKQLSINEQQWKQSQNTLLKEKQQLLDLNQKLVIANEQLAKKVEKEHRQKQYLQLESRKFKEQQNKMETKFSRQIQNIKLMHEQQLYIIRKKNKQ